MSIRLESQRFRLFRPIASMALICLVGGMAGAWAASTINAADPFAFGANNGWINAQGDVPNGSVIGEYVCSIYLY